MNSTFTVLLKGIRWQNLLIVLLVLSVSHFLLVQPSNRAIGLESGLDLMEFMLLALSIVFIMAGGNVINDYFDVDTDRENRRFNLVAIIGRSKTLLIYSFLSFSGLVYGLWLTYRIDELLLWSVHLTAVLLLFLYSKKLKSIPLVGNLTVALLCGIIPILPVFFEHHSMEHLFHPSSFILVFLSLLAFLSTLVRELVKDMEDIEGDEKTGKMTLPVVLGTANSKALVIIFFSMFMLLIVSVILFMTRGDLLSQCYLSFALLFPSVILFVKMLNTNEEKGFHQISKALKGLMFVGISYGIVYYYIYL